jgi:hypothetical protein
MSVSAAVLATIGLAGSFLPREALQWLGSPPSAPLELMLQVLGALSLGFAMLDWMSRHTVIGGIYGRPLVVGNLLHFASGALALAKGLLRAPEARLIWPLALVYAALALGFTVALFRHPARGTAPSNGGGAEAARGEPTA